MVQGNYIPYTPVLSIDYPLLTGDKEFKKLGDKVKVEWIQEEEMGEAPLSYTEPLGF